MQLREKTGIPMEKKINTIIQKYADNEILLDKLVVSSCCQFYNIEIGASYLAAFTPEEQDQLTDDIAFFGQSL